MSNLSKIKEMLSDKSGISEIKDDCDIHIDLSLHGDDFHEFIEEYAGHFDIDMSNYLWYFHTDEEGLLFTKLFNRPNNQVNRIPISPKTLDQFSINKKWDLSYPIHSIKTYNKTVNTIIYSSIGIIVLCFISVILGWYGMI